MQIKVVLPNLKVCDSTVFPINSYCRLRFWTAFTRSLMNPYILNREDHEFGVVKPAAIIDASTTITTSEASWPKYRVTFDNKEICKYSKWTFRFIPKTPFLKGDTLILRFPAEQRFTFDL